ncbi:MAG: cullin, partial [Candidatus Roizmanbacteria bacterium]
RTCQDLLERESLSGYLQIANKFYNDEKSRCERYLIWDIKEKILAEFRTEMLLTHQLSLLERESGIKYLLAQDKNEDLQLLYGLYHKTPEHLKPISEAFKQHILVQGYNFLDKLHSNTGGSAEE